MKKSLRFAATVTAVATMIACFAGCGKSGTNTGDGTYFIGATGPLTGDNAQYGISVKNGAQLAIDEINAAGGLNGAKFKFEMRDDKGVAAEAATGYDSLFDAGMQISLGSVTSGACEAFGTKAAQDNLFFITPSASAASVIETGDSAFRVCFGDPDQGVLAAKELTKNFKNIGCIYDTSDTYSTGVYEAFKDKMDKLGVSFKTQTFDKENNKDFSVQVEALKDCDAIFTPFYYTEAGLVAKACAKKGCEALIFGCDGLDGVKTQLDDTVTNHVKYITPFDVTSTDEKTAAFVKAYKAAYGSDPDQFAADGYDAVYVVYEAMKAAGVNDTGISASDLSDLVKAAITADSFSYAGVTGKMTWDASGACTKVPVIVDVR